MVSSEKLSAKIKSIKEYLEMKQEAVPFGEIEQKFLDGEKLPVVFDYSAYDIECLLIYQIPSYNDLDMVEIEIEFSLEKWGDSRYLYKKYLILKNLLWDFLEKEFRIVLLKNKDFFKINNSHERNILTKHIIELLSNDTMNYFEDIFNLDELINRFVFKSKDYLLKNGYVFNLKSSNNFLSKILLKDICDLLREHKTLTIDELEYLLQLYYQKKLNNLLPEGLVKFININNKRILYSNDQITLTDDLEYFEYHFNNFRMDFDEIYNLLDFHSSYKWEGIIAIIFNGKNFLIEEAKEYIATRPIIYIGLTSQISKFFIFDRNKFSFHSDTILVDFINKSDKSKKESIMELEELYRYLLSILGSWENVKNWLKENVVFSIYEEAVKGLEPVYQKLIEKYSPIFNVNNNPGNLFAYTLEQKVQEFVEKQENENKDN